VLEEGKGKKKSLPIWRSQQKVLFLKLNSNHTLIIYLYLSYRGQVYGRFFVDYLVYVARTINSSTLLKVVVIEI
jgi:hypothetical protein